MALSKQSIRKHAGMFTPREVHVPAWADENGDDVVLVRGMTIEEYELNVQGSADKAGHATATVLTRCVLADDGTRLFTDADVDWLSQLPVAQVKLLDRAIMEESGLSADEPDAEKAAAKAVADAEGNSAAAPTSDSGSGSLSD